MAAERRTETRRPGRAADRAAPPWGSTGAAPSQRQPPEDSPGEKADAEHDPAQDRGDPHGVLAGLQGPDDAGGDLLGTGGEGCRTQPGGHPGADEPGPHDDDPRPRARQGVTEALEEGVHPG